MSPERLNIKVPEYPSGENLARTTIVLSREALFKTYPILQETQYIQNIPTADSVHFVSFDEILEQEKKEKNGESLLYQALKACDIPIENIDNLYYRSIRENVYRSFQNRQDLFVNKEFIEAMDNSNPILRVSEAISFGRAFIKDCLENAPTERSLPIYPWKEILRRSLDEMFNTLKKEDLGSVTKLNDARDMVSSLLDDDLEIVANGTTIRALFPGQNLATAEFYHGSYFNSGVALSLSQRVRPNLEGLVRKKYGFMPKISAVVKTPNEIRAERICNKLSMPSSPLAFIDNNFRKQRVEQQPLINYYLDSLIPSYVVQTARTNPYRLRYPS